jgi:hypothetical protein
MDKRRRLGRVAGSPESLLKVALMLFAAFGRDTAQLAQQAAAQDGQQQRTMNCTVSTWLLDPVEQNYPFRSSSAL